MPDPSTGKPLDDTVNRAACYRCHPGSETRCLRGTMGSAVAADGAYAMQCQGCHGNLARVGDPNRRGWLDEPACQNWLSRHDNAAEANLNGCRTCHGTDLRGTVLSRVLGDRTLNAFGTKSWWRGLQVGCYNCHGGPSNDDATSNHPAVVTNGAITATAGQSVSTTLTASDADGNALTLRIVSQPAHGRVALADRAATYFPNPGFAGTDGFTFAAWDGSTDSNLGTVSVSVVESTCAIELTATGPTEVTAGSTVLSRAAAVVSDCAQPVRYEWTWDDQTEPMAGNTACRRFGPPGVVHWQLRATAGAATKLLTGAVTVLNAPDGEVGLAVSRAGNAVVIQWPVTAAGYQLESAPSVSGAVWTVANQVPEVVEDRYTVTVQANGARQYFRLVGMPREVVHGY